MNLLFFSLFRTILGGFTDPTIDVTDPISDRFYKEVWMTISGRNATIYEKVRDIQILCCLPRACIWNNKGHSRHVNYDLEMLLIHLWDIAFHPSSLEISYLAALQQATNVNVTEGYSFNLQFWANRFNKCQLFYIFFLFNVIILILFFLYFAAWDHILYHMRWWLQSYKKQFYGDHMTRIM